jgi:hypothetical protein
MNRRLLLLLLFGLALVSDNKPADAGNYETLTLDCKLRAVSVLSEDKGLITAKAIAANDEMTLTFSGFDEKAGSALVIANQGSEPAAFYAVGDHFQIIELTAAKNVATTTISISKNNIRAVHTRHMWMFDGGVFSTYVGPCSLR